jgi:hypothetical protein
VCVWVQAWVSFSSSSKKSKEQLLGISPIFGLDNKSWFEKSNSPSSIKAEIYQTKEKQTQNPVKKI